MHNMLLLRRCVMYVIHVIKVIIINDARCIDCTKINKKNCNTLEFPNLQMVLGGSVSGLRNDAGVV